jgi:hypothetical protein
MSDEGISIEARGGGLWAKVNGLTGKQLLLFLIFLTLAGVLALMVRNETVRDANFASIMAQLNEATLRDGQARTDRMVILNAIEGIVDEQRTTTYVLTLDQKQREALNLRMPKSLRDRERR